MGNKSHAKALLVKESPIIPSNSFCLGHLELGIGPRLKNKLFAQRDTVEKSSPLFASDYQLEIVSSSEMWACVHFTSQL